MCFLIPARSYYEPAAAFFYEAELSLLPDLLASGRGGAKALPERTAVG